MKIAVVGATGNIGSQLCHRLLEAGHQVRALSRGGPQLDRLVELGAEPFIGSFDEGTFDGPAFFNGADAAFTMVKTDWSNLHGHYSKVAERLAKALDGSSVDLVVNLSSFGGDQKEGTGHFVGFHQLEQILDRRKEIRMVHLRGGYFMANMLAWVDSVARHSRIAWYFGPDTTVPLVETRDIATVAAAQFLSPTEAAHTICEVGAEERTMREVAAIIGREIGRPVEATTISSERADVRERFISQFGTEEKWDYDVKTYRAIDDGRVRFHTRRGPLPTSFEQFVRDTWKPAYDKALTDHHTRPQDFASWLGSL
jgi:uncharacterized protein YbjT (DUF2867 family)